MKRYHFGVLNDTLSRFLAAVAIAAIALAVYDHKKIDVDKFALDPSIVLARETWQNKPYTGSDMPSIRAAIASAADRPRGSPSCPPFTALWLGNSQLHFVNQYRRGDHVAPYWVRRGLDCPDAQFALGISMPNANDQEYYALLIYALRRAPIDAVVLELVFDELREDGLRDDFATLLTDDDQREMRKRPAGRAVLARADAEWKNANRAVENSGLHGFVQKYLEDGLDKALGSVWPLWRDRKNLQNLLLVDLYYLRNAVLGIKPTTVRKLIAARYERNMGAFVELLQLCRERNLPVVAYIAPIRQDHKLPYDPQQYAAWKEKTAEIMQQYGDTLLNFEKLVPNRDWGSYHADDIDFMHFQGAGHKILGETLLPYLRSLPKAREQSAIQHH